jgi:hypothetical protein
VIALPFNDLGCLSSISELIAELVKQRDPVIVELAAKHGSTEALAEWIRSLAQRDDDGEERDGPRVDMCEPSQRLRIAPQDPNCVERAALYLGVAELIDPKPVRQLATLDTPVGLHTFPLENGAPVILDPRVPRNSLDCGLACHKEGPVVVEAREAIEWTAQLAQAGAAQHRNGPSRVRRARNAIVQLVDEGIAPTDPNTIDALGWFFAIAEQKAREFGGRALAIVKSVALAISDLIDDALARGPRNLALDIAGFRLEAPPFVSALAQVAGRIGLDVGAAALRSKLGALGIGDDMIGLVEQELNREGLSLGPLANPPKLPTFASMQQSAQKKSAA